MCFFCNGELFPQSFTHLKYGQSTARTATIHRAVSNDFSYFQTVPDFVRSRHSHSIALPRLTKSAFTRAPTQAMIRASYTVTPATAYRTKPLLSILSTPPSYPSSNILSSFIASDAFQSHCIPTKRDETQLMHPQREVGTQQQPREQRYLPSDSSQPHFGPQHYPVKGVIFDTAQCSHLASHLNNGCSDTFCHSTNQPTQ